LSFNFPAAHRREAGSRNKSENRRFPPHHGRVVADPHPFGKTGDKTSD